jgi:hypothetical protein
MQEATANPVWVALLCVARCLIPLLILLGISYLLKKFGFIAETPAPPNGYADDENNNA